MKTLIIVAVLTALFLTGCGELEPGTRVSVTGEGCDHPTPEAYWGDNVVTQCKDLGSATGTVEVGGDIGNGQPAAHYEDWTRVHLDGGDTVVWVQNDNVKHLD